MVDVTAPQPLASWPGETPVLMGDWLLKPVSELVPGDTVVGLETGCSANRSKLVPAKVLTVSEVSAAVVTLRTDSGATARCSVDTLWYRNRFPSLREPARRAYGKARRGSALMQIDFVEDPPTGREHLLWYWLAGMVDGEGHVADSSLPITQTTVKNRPVWEKLCAVLDELGIDFNMRMYDTVPEKWQPRGDAVIRNVRDVYKRLLRYTELGKRDQVVDALWRRPRRPIRAHDRVVEVGQPEEMTAWQVETTSGNQIVWGYLASNYALDRTCPAGHVLDIREDAAGKTYQKCPVCGPSAAMVAANERRRQWAQASMDLNPEDEAALAFANEAVASGAAAALRVAAGITQVLFAATCDVSQPRLSNWENGGSVPASPAGLRYARSLCRLRAGV